MYPGLIRVTGKSNGNGIANSAFIIIDRKIAVIDTGSKGELWREVIDAIKKSGKDPKKDVSYILLTHEHLDHFGSAFDLKSATGGKIYIHGTGAEALRDPSTLATKHFNVFGESSAETRKLKSTFGKIAPINPDSILLGGEKLDLGFSTLTVIHSGGHCGGHVMYYDDYRRAVFAGDEVIEVPSNPGKYVIDLTGSAERKEIILNRLLELRIDLLVPSHDAPYSGGNIKEQVNRAVDAHEIWKKEVYETVSQLGEAKTQQVANMIEKSLNLGWSGELKSVATALTTSAYLKMLSSKGQVQESEDEKAEEKKWTVS